MGGKVVTHELTHRFARLDCAACVVRLQQDVGEFEEAKSQEKVHRLDGSGVSQNTLRYSRTPGKPVQSDKA